MIRPVLLLGAICAVAVVALTATAQLPHPASQFVGDVTRGERLYAVRCGACHSLDANRVGPMHRGVVGRRSAQVADFRYSAALQRLSVVWTPGNLDTWLANPTGMAPGTSMGARVTSAQERADIIAYLSSTEPRAD